MHISKYANVLACLLTYLLTYLLTLIDGASFVVQRWAAWDTRSALWHGAAVMTSHIVSDEPSIMFHGRRARGERASALFPYTSPGQPTHTHTHTIISRRYRSSSKPVHACIRQSVESVGRSVVDLTSAVIRNSEERTADHHRYKYNSAHYSRLDHSLDRRWSTWKFVIAGLLPTADTSSESRSLRRRRRQRQHCDNHRPGRAGPGLPLDEICTVSSLGARRGVGVVCVRSAILLYFCYKDLIDGNI